MAVRWLRLATALVLVLIAYALVPTSLDAQASTLLRIAGLLLVLAGAAVVMIRQLRLSAFDWDRGIDGLVLAVEVMTVAFALIFYVLALEDPGQVAGLHTRLDSLYFTASTMLTVGYGDVHAEGQAARAVVLIQMVFDVVFIAAAAGMLSSRVRRAASARVAAAVDPAADGADSPTETEPDLS
jgi:voltage-gated potassium channel